MTDRTDRNQRQCGSPPTVLVRSAQPAELDRVAELSVEVYAEFAPFLETGGWQRMRGGILSVVRRDGCAVILAEGREGLAGSVAYFPPGSDKGEAYPKEWAAVRLLAVSPTYRGKGIGGALMEECLRRARADGATEVGLHTSELMVAARSMYERMGFVQREELPPVFGTRYWSYSLKLC